MICRQCGTEIADKAIVCFRCGAGTSDPVRKPAALQPRRGWLLPLVGLILLSLLGLYLGQAGRVSSQSPANLYNVAAGICILIAMVLLIVRISRRR